MEDKRVAIVTTFYQWSKAYSLTTVVEHQLKALLNHGYEPVLFVHDNFKGDDRVPEGVEIRKVIPRFELVDYSANSKLADDFFVQVDKAQEAFEEHLKDIDAVFTHDLIFQGWFLNYNVAMRRAAENLDCRWFHWIHSAPSPRPADLEFPFDCRYKMMKNSKLVYMNEYDSLRLAEMYAGTLDDVRVVHNPMDLRLFLDLHPLVEKVIKKYAIFKADVVATYPISSTRFAGKKPRKVMKILAEMKKQGKDVRFICCNAHANAEKEKKAIKRMIQDGIEYGLSRKDMIFTSFEDEPEYEHGVPNRAVRDFMRLSNVFIFPTISENAPLILLEAAASNCLLVLNKSFPALREFFGPDALYFEFGSLVQNVEYDNEDRYFSDVAKVILGELNKNRPLNAFTKLKQKYNYDYMFKNELEPILWEQW